MMGFHGMSRSGLSAYVEDQKKRGRKTDAQTVRRVIQSFKPYKLQVVFVLLAILLTTGLGLVNPLMIALIFDDAIGKRDLQKLVLYVVIMLVTPIISGLIVSGRVI